MSFTLFEVDVSDAANIARYIEVPAMQNGPLYRTMFPRSNTMTKVQRGEVIRWYTSLLEDAFQDRWERFLKVCFVDGIPVGFCGWTIIDRNREHQVQANAGANKRRDKETWLPEVIDVDGWTTLSTALRKERDQVLKNLDNICR